MRPSRTSQYRSGDRHWRDRPWNFIPRLVNLFMAGRVALNRLITRYDFADAIAPALARKARVALQWSAQWPLDGNRGGIHCAVSRSGHRVARSRVLCRGCDTWSARHDRAPKRIRRREGPGKYIT